MSLALPRIAQERGWTTAEVGANGAKLIAVFFVGYGLSNMFLSPVAERFGPRRSIVAAIVAFSLCTALNAPLGSTIAALVVLRLLLGIGEGVHFPMASAIVSGWFPLGERSRANGHLDLSSPSSLSSWAPSCYSRSSSTSVGGPCFWFWELPAS